jgi:hypothetical protein
MYFLLAADVPVANNPRTPMLVIGSIGSSKQRHLRCVTTGEDDFRVDA